MDLLERLAWLEPRIELCRSRLPVVFRGELLHRCYVVKRGAASAEHKGRVVALGPGDFFGDEALYGDSVSRSTVRPLADGLALLAIPPEDLRTAMARDHALGELLMRARRS